MKKYTLMILVLVLAMAAGCKSNEPAATSQENEEKQNLDVVILEIDPVQCQGNPWEQEWLRSNPGKNYPISEEFEVFKSYYLNAYEIVIHEISKKTTHEFVCEACSCPRGDTFYVVIERKDMAVLIDLGYKESGLSEDE